LLGFTHLGARLPVVALAGRASTLMINENGTALAAAAVTTTTAAAATFWAINLAVAWRRLSLARWGTILRQSDKAPVLPFGAAWPPKGGLTKRVS